MKKPMRTCCLMIGLCSASISVAMADMDEIRALKEAEAHVSKYYPEYKTDPASVIWVDRIDSTLERQSFLSFGEYDSELNTVRLARFSSDAYKQIRDAYSSQKAFEIFRGKVVHELAHQAQQPGNRVDREIDAYSIEVKSWSDGLRQSVINELEPTPWTDKENVSLDEMIDNPMGFAIKSHLLDSRP